MTADHGAAALFQVDPTLLLTGKPPKGVGPQDVAIALVGATFPKGDVKNKVLEFVGPGVKELSCDFRIGVDVMTTETSCLTSIWQTDETIRAYYENIGRPADFKVLTPGEGAYYDSVVTIDLSTVEPMIALPFHPSIAYTIHEVQENPEKIFAEVEEACNQQLGGKVTLDLRHNIVDGKVHCEQGVIVGCSGGMYENICEAAAILAEQGELVRRQFGYTAGEIPDAQTFALLVEPYRLGALKNAVIRAITIGYGREITAPGDDEYDEGLAELHQKKTRLREPNTSA